MQGWGRDCDREDRKGEVGRERERKKQGCWEGDMVEGNVG